MTNLNAKSLAPKNATPSIARQVAIKVVLGPQKAVAAREVRPLGPPQERRGRGPGDRLQGREQGAVLGPSVRPRPRRAEKRSAFRHPSLPLAGGRPHGAGHCRRFRRVCAFLSSATPRGASRAGGWPITDSSARRHRSSSRQRARARPLHRPETKTPRWRETRTRKRVRATSSSAAARCIAAPSRLPCRRTPTPEDHRAPRRLSDRPRDKTSHDAPADALENRGANIGFPPCV